MPLASLLGVQREEQRTWSHRYYAPAEAPGHESGGRGEMSRIGLELLGKMLKLPLSNSMCILAGLCLNCGNQMCYIASD